MANRKYLSTAAAMVISFVAGLALRGPSHGEASTAEWFSADAWSDSLSLGGLGPHRGAGARSACPAACLDDPYVRPGMVLWGKDQLGKETRYVPFPSGGAAGLPAMRTTELDAGGTAYWGNTTEALALAVPAYTQAVKAKDEETVGFARGKIALFIGESGRCAGSPVCAG